MMGGPYVVATGDMGSSPGLALDWVQLQVLVHSKTDKLVGAEKPPDESAKPPWATMVAMACARVLAVMLDPRTICSAAHLGCLVLTIGNGAPDLWLRTLKRLCRSPD